MSPSNRLTEVVKNFTQSTNLLPRSLPLSTLAGKLTIGTITVPVYEAKDPLVTPTFSLISLKSEENKSHLHWLLQKYILDQNAYLLGPPGPFARHLALTFGYLMKKEVEILVLHRDSGESELKQGREIR